MSTRDTGSLDANTASAVFASGLNSKVLAVQKFGYNPDVDTAAEEDLWDVGGMYDYATVSSKVNVVSSSAADSPTGAGIAVVFLVGLNDNYDEVTELVQLNGITPVESVNDYIRIFRIRAFSAGAGGTENGDASGDITATSIAEGKLQAAIMAGNTTTKMSMYTVPRNYTAFVTGGIVSGGPNDDFVVDFQIRSPGGLFVTTSDIEISNSGIAQPVYNPFLGPVPERTDIKLKAFAVTNNAQVRVGYSLMLLRNDYLNSLAESI